MPGGETFYKSRLVVCYFGKRFHFRCLAGLSICLCSQQNMFKVNITNFREMFKNCSMLAIRALRDHLNFAKFRIFLRIMG